MAHKLTLFHYWRSSCSWRVRWSLAHKDVTYEAVHVNLLKGEQHGDAYLARNPYGTVPCLEVDGVPLSESLAILEWLEQAYPQKPLLPIDPLVRAWVRQFCLTIIAGIQPLQNLSVLRHYSSDDKAQKEWARHWMEKGLTACEALLAPKAGEFCFGDEPTLADLCLVPQMYNAHRFELDVTGYPTCERLYRHCLTVESCAASAPDRYQPRD